MNDLWFNVLWVFAHILYTLAAIYYLFVMFPAYLRGKKGYITNTAPTIERIRRVMRKKKVDRIPMFKFQITTKGGETHVVNRGIRSIVSLVGQPLYKDRLRIDVVTERAKDRKEIMKEFADCPIPLNIHVVPKRYKTKNRTMKKARALHYMIELRRKEETERGYIIHMDAESVITHVDFRRIVYNTVKHQKKITEGPIVYPIRWFESNLLSRQMEANRPFHCYHCHKVMKDPPPSHLHGSNLVIEEALSLELGWDFGNLDGQPFIAEDLVLGLTAYMRYGKDVFGWHGAELLEQPPMTLGDSVRQRIRWVTGVWQALEMLKRSKGFKKMDWKERFRLRATISYRATLYSMSFFTALFFYFFIAVWFSSEVLHLEVFKVEIDILRYWAIILLPGLVLWLAGNQIGLKRILERKKVSTGDKAVEHLKILLASPVGAPVETISALYATLKWFLGDRKVTWIPTKK